MSDNPLINLTNTVFKNSLKLKLNLLYMVNVSLKDIDIFALHNSRLEFIITDDYHLCCISTSETVCPTTKSRSSCILINISTSKSSKTFSMSVIAINFNDLLCGVYLACI